MSNRSAKNGDTSPLHQRTIKILLLAANPADTPRLRFDLEHRAIVDVLRKTEFRDAFIVVEESALRVGDLSDRLLYHKPDIVHFIGHGDKDRLILENDAGNSAFAHNAALKKIFAIFKNHIQCALFSACYTEDLAKAVAEEVQCVIGIANVIEDGAAVAFAVAFYNALGYGMNLQDAFSLGLVQLELTNSPYRENVKIFGKGVNRHVLFVEQSIETPTVEQYNSVSSKEYSTAIEYIKWERWPAVLAAWPTIKFDKQQASDSNNLNPFGAIQAEEDRFLFDIGRRQQKWAQQLSKHLPEWAKPLADFRSVLTTGESGSGKTASALIAAHDFLSRYEDILPIYWSCPIQFSESYEQLCSFGYALAYTLVGYLSVKPHKYFAATETTQPTTEKRQEAVALLLATHFGSGPNLPYILQEFQYHPEVDLQPLCTALQEKSKGFDATYFKPTPFHQELYLRILANANLPTINRRILFLDLQSTKNTPSAIPLGFELALLETITRLTDSGFIIKAFVPFEPSLPLMQAFQETVRPVWQRHEIKQILVDRLLIIDNTGDGGLNTLCDPRSVNNIDEIEEAVLAVSGNMPGRLMAIGNQFASRFYQKGKLLERRDVDEILKLHGNVAKA